MGTMNKMRENTGIVLWVLVISFGGLWVLQDSGVFDTIGANPQGNIIIVDGEPITADFYQRQLEAQLEQIRQRTGEQVQPEQLEQMRERVFEALVDDKIRIREMDRLGIAVSETEIRDLIVGDIPHPIIRTYFPNESGGVDRALLQSAIDNPEQADLWIQMEEYIRLDRRREKFETLLSATVRVSEADIEAEYERTTATVSTEFFFLSYAALSDDSLEVTDSDIRRFYNDNKEEEFKQERLYSIDLASLSKLPSAEDTTTIVQEIAELRAEFETTDDDSLFLARNGSENALSDAFLGAAELDAVITKVLYEENEEDIEPGTIIGPVTGIDAVHLVKILETRPAEDTNIRARHILIRAGEEAQKEGSRRRITEIQQRIEGGEDFSVVAREASEDTGSGARGGDLGWFGPGTMVPAFQDAAFAAPVGTLIGPVETDFGFHLIEVTHRAQQEVRIADLALSLDVSLATINEITESLEDLRFYTEETGDFTGEAERRSIALQSLSMQEGQTAIPAVGSSRAVAQFLETADVGDVSPLVELNNVILVVHVNDIEEEGYFPLEDVESNIRSRVLLTKKREAQLERMEQAYAVSGYEGLAAALESAPQKAANIGFSRQTVPGIGRDPIFAGTALGLAEGKDSGVVEGNTGAFVVRVTERNEPAPIADSERERLLTHLSSSQRSRLLDRWIRTLREDADIQDQRRDFLQ